MTKVKKKTSKTRLKRKVSKASSKKSFLKINEDIWPIERDVFFRPDRYKYVRKIIKPNACVFCTAEKQDLSVESLCIFKSKHSMILLNKFPYNSGHLLVIPRKHCGDILELTDEEYFELQNCVRLAVLALKEVYSPAGFNIGLNHGSVAGAGIPEHVHYHVVPRWSGDLNFFPLIAKTKVVIETLDITFKKLLGYFKKYE